MLCVWLVLFKYLFEILCSEKLISFSEHKCILKEQSFHQFCVCSVNVLIDNSNVSQHGLN